MVPEVDRASLIEMLEQGYADDGSSAGWRGGTNDNDRLHAAIASAFHMTHLVTWDEAFMRRERWVAEVNGRHGLAELKFTNPG
ncbi:MAG: hypothetical protein NVSMB52_08290 [Chloroflexota bacterium]